MKYKTWKDGKEVSVLGFGTWGIGGTMWIGAEDTESKKILHQAMENGINFFDTALVYGNGHSEVLLGEAEREFGKPVFIASKLPSKKMEWPAWEHSLAKDSFPADHIIKMTEKSLHNLKRDYLDLQQFHVWNDKWAADDEWKTAVRNLKEQGKVRSFGISINDHQPWNGIETAKSGLIDSFQVIFNIFDQSPLDALFPFCLENDVKIIVRVPFDEGGLTGTIHPGSVFPQHDWRNNYFRGERKQQVAERVALIDEDIRGECANIAEAALRYIISFEAVTTVIPGMRREKSLHANLDSISKGVLPKEVLEKMPAHRWDRNFYR